MARFTDVAVIGAGPYGLSVSAELTARGIEHRIFGPPMQTWQSMPKGMFLKSLDFATYVSTPKPGYTLIDYAEKHGLSHAEPLPAELFCSYGMWAAEQLCPHLEPIEVNRLTKPGDNFEITTATGETFEARRVVMATGLAYFARTPKIFKDLPRELVSHTAHHREFEQFRDKDVWVLGAGQSAIEAAVMLHEAGARTTVLTRGGPPIFHGHTGEKRILRHRILHPMSVFGASRTGFFLQHLPKVMYYVPDKKRIEVTRRLFGPSGAWWITHRFQGKVPTLPYQDILSATPKGDRLALRLRDTQTSTEKEVVIDKLICGTGYEPDLEVIPFFDKTLAARVARIERAPRLKEGFESSVSRLYFVGASAMFSYGPLLRFVAGTPFAAPAVAEHLLRNRDRNRVAVPREASAPLL
jgi:cation diffusion facilitator CzcD-associated flavoprotein CzcO